MITLRQVEAFKAIVESGTVRQAAQAMHLSQPSVSRLLADLEAAIGYRLFARQKGRLVARREAQELYAVVQRTFSGLARVSEAAQRIGRNSTERLRVAIAPIFDAPPLARVTARLLDRHPDAFISLTSRTEPRILDEVAAGQHDIAVATLPVGRADIIARPIAELACHCLVPDSHPPSGRGSISPRDLEGARLIVSADSNPVQQTVDEVLRDAGVQCTQRIETTTTQMATDLVAEGAGVNVTLSQLTDCPPRSGITAIPFHPTIRVGVVALFAFDHPPHLLAAQFAQMCSEALRDRSARVGVAEKSTSISGTPLSAPL